MYELLIDLDLSSEELLKYYRGEARNVRARATSGHIVQFPASVLSRFVGLGGIHGRFRLVFDENRKFVQIDRLRAPEPPGAVLPAPDNLLGRA